MLNLVFTIAVAAVIAVGVTDIVKNLLPTVLSGTKVKTIAGIVITALIGLATGFVSAKFGCLLGGFSTAVFCVIVAVGTVGASVYLYNYIAKLLAAIVAKLKA